MSSLYIRHLGDSGPMASSVNTSMHAVRGFFRFAHIDGLIRGDPARVYARLARVESDESRTQGLDRLELIRFLQVAQTITVHHGALAGINALRASEAAAVRIEDYQDTLRGHRVLHLVGKGSKPATMPITVPVLRVLEACRGQRTEGPLVLRPLSGGPIDRRDAYRMVARIARAAGIQHPISPHSLRHAAIINALDAGVPLRDAQILARHAPGPPSTTTAPGGTSTDTASTSSPPTSLESDRLDGPWWALSALPTGLIWSPSTTAGMWDHALVTSRGSMLVVELKALEGDRANSRRSWRVSCRAAQLRTTWNVGLARVTQSAAARRSRQIVWSNP